MSIALTAEKLYKVSHAHLPKSLVFGHDCRYRPGGSRLSAGCSSPTQYCYSDFDLEKDKYCFSLTDPRLGRIKELEKDYEIFLIEDNPALFSEEFLDFLKAFFGNVFGEVEESTDAGVTDAGAKKRRIRHSYGRLHLYASADTGPKLVWVKSVEETILVKKVYFSLSAKDALNPQRATTVSPGASGNANAVEEDHNLVLQLLDLFADGLELERFVENSFHVKVRLGKDVKDLSRSRTFREGELLEIIKALIDLPPKIIENWPLKYILSVYGNRFQSNYDPTEQVLSIAVPIGGEINHKGKDPSALESKSLFSLVLLKGIGAIAWSATAPAAKAKFAALSWAGDGQIKAQASNFVNSMAKESIESDFAEHFASYVYNAEAIRTHAKDKYDFLHKTYFPDREYFTKGIGIYVKSENPDTDPPVLSSDVKNFIELSITNDPVPKLKARVTGISDKKSGIANIFIHFKNEDGSLAPQSLFLSERHLLSAKGLKAKPNAIYESTEDLDPALKPGTLKVESVRVVDGAENELQVPESRFQSIGIKISSDIMEKVMEAHKGNSSVEGDLPIESEIVTQVDPKKILIKPIDSKMGLDIYRITLPLRTVQSLNSITLKWGFVDEAEKDRIKGSLENDFEIGKIHVNAGAQTVSMDFTFNPGLRSGKIQLSKIKVSYMSAKYDFLHVSIDTRPYPDLSVDWKSSVSKPTPISIDANNIKVREDPALDGKGKTNMYGGIVTVLVDIPFDALDSQIASGHVILHTPSGGSLFGSFKPEDCKLDSAMNKVVCTASIPFHKNHEEGQYVLDSLDATEILKPVQGLGPNIVPLSLGSKQDNTVAEKLSSRGIRREIQIQSLGEGKLK